MAKWDMTSPDVEILADRYKRAPHVLGDFVEKNLRALGLVIAAKERRVLGVVKYRGTVERSVSIQFTAQAPRYQITIGPTAKHRAVVLTGSRPHWAPIAPLKEWARWKLGDEKAAYAIQKSIAMLGTSQWLLKRGIKDNEITPFGIGYNYVRGTLNRGDVKLGIERLRQRIPVQVKTFLEQGRIDDATAAGSAT